MNYRVSRQEHTGTQGIYCLMLSKQIKGLLNNMFHRRKFACALITAGKPTLFWVNDVNTALT
jgi:hypothetical protein